MTLTFGRWLACIAIGCAAIAAAFLPAERQSYWDSEWHIRQSHTAGYAWMQRANARSRHTADLVLAYREASDRELARRTFGNRAAGVGEPEVVFASDVSPSARANVIRVLREERAALGEWKGRGKVGLIVLMDTAATLGGDTITPLKGRSSWNRFRSFPPAASTEDRCVTVMRLRSAWSGAAMTPARGRALLNVCALYDRFGVPGAGLDQLLFTRRDSVATPPAAPFTVSSDLSSVKWLDRSLGAVANQSLSSVSCRAGSVSACYRLAGVSADSGAGRADTLHRGSFRDGGREFPWATGPAPSTLMSLITDLGPERFERVWRSARPLPEAVFDVTGTRFDAWVRQREVAADGAYRAGPWTSPSSLLLTALVIAGLFAIAGEAIGRPRVT